MTQKEIVEMARQAGFIWGLDIGLQLEAFAKLVAAKEREACAKMCEDASKPHNGEIHSDAQWAGLVLATTIRTRGEA